MCGVAEQSRGAQFRTHQHTTSHAIRSGTLVQRYAEIRAKHKPRARLTKHKTRRNKQRNRNRSMPTLTHRNKESAKYDITNAVARKHTTKHTTSTSCERKPRLMGKCEKCNGAQGVCMRNSQVAHHWKAQETAKRMMYEASGEVVGKILSRWREEPIQGFNPCVSSTPESFRL